MGRFPKIYFNSQEFTIEDTASGTARLHIESNQFAGSPAIELSFSPSNNLNAPGIKLSTTNFARILLETTDGQINQKTDSGQINLQTTTGSIQMRRGSAPNYSTMEIQSSGDLNIETDLSGNQIRLKTNGTNSDIELRAAQSNIKAYSLALDVANTLGNANGIINIKGPTNNNNIILTGQTVHYSSVLLFNR